MSHPPTGDDIRRLYPLLFNREAESEEAIAAHLIHPTVVDVVATLMESAEYQAQRGRYPLDHLFDGHTAADAAILRRHVDAGAGEPGFVKDFVGTRMRIEHADFTRGLSGVAFTKPPVPGDYRAEAVEWIGALKAVEAAADRFVVAELGAGWGPWIVSTGHVARKLGKEVKLYGLEADPGKAENMRIHMQDNGFDPSQHSISHAIAGPIDGPAYFPVIDSADNWGGEAVFGEKPEGDYRELQSVRLSSLLAHEPIVDLVHIDIQGAEGAVIRDAIDFVSNHVRYLVIGTHSRVVEADLITTLMPSFDLEHEQPARCTYEAGASVILVDGTQVWRNRSL